MLNIIILNNPKIKKVHLTGDTYITTEIYADDLSVVLPNLIESIEEAIKTIKNFENYSGLAINLDKSTLSVIGHNHDMKHLEIDDKTIEWTKTFKILGIEYTTCLTRSEENFKKPLEEIQSMIEEWSKKLCTTIGRANVANAQLGSNRLNSAMKREG